MTKGMLAVSNKNIDVWLAFYDEIDDEQLLGRYRALLSDDEREQEFRFYFADDRRRYLVTRAMVRTILSRYVDVEPGDWVFSANAYGRPEIANDHTGARHLSFNVSHTRGLVALAVGRQRALGVDVENLLVRQVSTAIADKFFSSDEVAELSLVPNCRKQDRFFEYWTFKESYIKARGMGLSIPLDKFSFHYPHERAVRISIQPELGDDYSRWGFWQFRPTDSHLMAVCTEHVDGQFPAVTIRKLVPTIAEEELQLMPFKVSDLASAP